MSEEETDTDTSSYFARLDAISNPYSGLAVFGVDPHEATTPNGGRLFSYGELASMFQFDRLARRIVERLPNDCLRRGFNVVTPDAPGVFDEDIKRLGLLGKLRTAHTEALKTGGAGIVIVTSDLATLDQPIDLKSLQEVQALHVFNRWELCPTEWSDDLESPDYDLPTLYNLSPFSTRTPTRRRKGAKGKQEAVTKVHASRVIRFLGLPVDRVNRSVYDGWAQPLLEGIWRSFRDVDVASQSIATVMREWKYDIFKVSKLLSLLAGPAGDPETAGNARWSRLLGAIKESKSVIGAVVIDKELAEWETRTVDFKGPVEGFGVLQQNLSADTEQPLSQLFGQSPKGFSGDDKPGRENWNNKTQSARVEVHTPAIERVVELLATSKRGPTKGQPVEATVVWPSLQEPDDKTKAETRKVVLEGDQILVDVGAATGEDVAKRHEGAEFALELQLEEVGDVGDFEEMEQIADSLRRDAARLAHRGDTSDFPLVIYHDPCNDGFTSAWVAYNYFGGQCELFPATHGDEPPDVTGRDVFIVDFSYPREALVEMAAQAKSIKVLDHHASAERNLKGLDFCEFDMDRSGAKMAWDHFYGDAPAPVLVEYVQDRDLWREALPFTKEVASYMKTVPREIGAFDDAQDALQTNFSGVVETGAAVLRSTNSMMDQLLAFAEEVEVLGHKVLKCPAPSDLRSEIAGKLAKGRPFGIGVFKDDDGNEVWSLRSREGGEDVSLIAEQFGGGGHPQAAGCKAPEGF